MFTDPESGSDSGCIGLRGSTGLVTEELRFILIWSAASNLEQVANLLCILPSAVLEISSLPNVSYELKYI